MTTIAVSFPLLTIAADSRMTVSNDIFGTEFAAGSTKLVRMRDWIVAGAGDSGDVLALMEWWKDRRKRRPKVGKDTEFLAMSRTKLLHIVGNSLPEALRDGYYAVGTGSPYAIASMTTQVHLGFDPDPKLAIQVACHHDPFSHEPIDFLSWRQS